MVKRTERLTSIPRQLSPSDLTSLAVFLSSISLSPLLHPLSHTAPPHSLLRTLPIFGQVPKRSRLHINYVFTGTSFSMEPTPLTVVKPVGHAPNL